MASGGNLILNEGDDGKKSLLFKQAVKAGLIVEYDSMFMNDYYTWTKKGFKLFVNE